MFVYRLQWLSLFFTSFDHWITVMLGYCLEGFRSHKLPPFIWYLLYRPFPKLLNHGDGNKTTPVVEQCETTNADIYTYKQTDTMGFNTVYVKQIHAQSIGRMRATD